MNKKLDLIIIISIIIGISLFQNIIFYLQFGDIKLTTQLIRFIFTVILCAGIFYENAFSIWTMGILGFIGGLFGIKISVTLFQDGYLMGSILLLLVAIFYIASAIYITIIRDYEYDEDVILENQVNK